MSKMGMAALEDVVAEASRPAPTSNPAHDLPLALPDVTLNKVPLKDALERLTQSAWEQMQNLSEM